MLKLQQSEVRDLEILANQGEGGNDHQEKGETIMSGIAKSRTFRSGKTESRSTGSKITGRIATIRNGKNESRNTGKIKTIRSGKNESRNAGSKITGTPAAMSPVAVPCSNSCSVP